MEPTQPIYPSIDLKEFKKNTMSNLKRWDSFHCFFMLGAVIAYWFIQWRMLVFIVALPSFIYLLISEWPMLKKLHPFGGYANWVTFLRLTGLLVLFAISGRLTNGQLATIFIVLVLLDGLDGILARRFHQETSFGANFDMETDALYVCFVSIILLEKGLTGSWILLAGFMRYFYVALVYFTGMHHLTEKRTKFGPLIGVVLFVALLIPFVLPRSIYFPCLIGASVLVTLSFAWSFYLQIVERRKSIK